MRALAVHAVPATPEPVEVADPKPESGEVLVRVVASSVNGFDAATAAGLVQDYMEHRFPLVLGKDFAGVVETAGEGVTGFAAGDEVFGVVMKPYVGSGSLAEYVTSDAAYVARIPAGMSVAEAGALGLAGAAAIDAIDAAAPAEGETVLVSGATGGVGMLAVQYALARGARVLATARPGSEQDLVRRVAAAAELVDYSGDVATQVRAIAPDGVDVVIHLAGDGAGLADLLVDGGRIASTLGLGPDAVQGRPVTATAVMASPVTATLDRVAADVAAGRIQLPVTRTYSLDDAATAFADFGAGALGKLAIKLT